MLWGLCIRRGPVIASGYWRDSIGQTHIPSSWLGHLLGTHTHLEDEEEKGDGKDRRGEEGEGREGGRKEIFIRFCGMFGCVYTYFSLTGHELLYPVQ